MDCDCDCHCEWFFTECANDCGCKQGWAGRGFHRRNEESTT